MTDPRPAFLNLTGGPETISPENGIRHMCTFYRSHPIAGTVPEAEDGDMLLFQWGRFDWGDGPHFSVSITRQLIFAQDDDPDIRHLSLAFRFDQITADTRGTLWCHSRKDLPDFADQIQASEALAVIAATSPDRIDLDWEQP